jgi:hypothetical protein
MRFDFLSKLAVDAMASGEIENPSHLFALCLE